MKSQLQLWISLILFSVSFYLMQFESLLNVHTFRMVPVLLFASFIKEVFSGFSPNLSECLIGFIERNPIKSAESSCSASLDSLHSVFSNLIKKHFQLTLLSRFAPGNQIFGFCCPLQVPFFPQISSSLVALQSQFSHKFNKSY